MQKNEKIGTQRKGSPLPLHRETLRVIDGPELRAAVGGGRIHIPIGFAADTTPLYNDAP